MNLIWKEYTGFLKDNGIEIDLKEGYYWLDRQIIKAYDKQGTLHKIARIYIDDDLNVSCTQYKQKCEVQIESWEETICRNIDRLHELESNSVKLIKNSLLKYDGYIPIVLTSTGKDSELVRFLVDKTIRENNLDKTPIILFNNTSLDCADTYKMAKSIPNCKILNPKRGFYNMVKEHGTPSRHHRWCCSIFKEGSTKDYLDANDKYLFFYGMRNQESSTRADYQDERYDNGWGTRDWMGILPIREWSEEEVWLYTLWRNIKINPKYKQGYARVGCAVACPFYVKSTWALDKYWYPKAYSRWHKILEDDFTKGHKWTRLNCTLKEYHSCWNGGLKRPEPTQEVIKEFAEYKGIDSEVAENFFNHTCEVCEKKVNKKDEIAMNLKFRGRETEKVFCKKHFMEYFNMESDMWDYYIQSFKDSGCSLF